MSEPVTPETERPEAEGPPGGGAEPSANDRRYWKRNQQLIAMLLAIWALVSYGFSILLAEPLSQIRIGKLPASFWWAQQGAMFVFVILIFVYAWRMDALDREHDLHEED